MVRHLSKSRGSMLLAGALSTIILGSVSPAAALNKEKAFDAAPNGKLIEITTDNLLDTAKDSIKSPLLSGFFITGQPFNLAVELTKLSITHPLDVIKDLLDPSKILNPLTPIKIISGLFDTTMTRQEALRKAAGEGFEGCAKDVSVISALSKKMNKQKVAIAALDKQKMLVSVTDLGAQQDNLDSLIDEEKDLKQNLDRGVIGRQVISKDDKVKMQQRIDALDVQIPQLQLQVLPAQIVAQKQIAAQSCLYAQIAGQEILRDAAMTNSFPKVAPTNKSTRAKLQKKMIVAIGNLAHLGQGKIIEDRILKMQQDLSTTDDGDDAAIQVAILDSWNEEIVTLYTTAQIYSDMLTAQKVALPADTASSLKKVRTFVKGLVLSNVNTLGFSNQYLAAGAPGRGVIPELRYPRL